MYTPFQNLLLPYSLSFFLYFLAPLYFLFLVSFMFLKNSPLIIGRGQKRGFAPILIIGGARARAAPRVYAYAWLQIQVLNLLNVK